MKNKLLHLFIFLAFLMPLSVLVLNAEDNKNKQEIPLHKNLSGDDGYDNRTLTSIPIECYYYGIMNILVTTFYSDLGDVSLTVTNCSTGNIWYDSFDSVLEPQTMLALSGEPGVYEIVYITESGGVYEGTLVLN